MKHLIDLNEAQKSAVTHADGPLLILAGAGAGKTRVITYRILHLIATGIDPRSILAVTFTNKAAKEMRERVQKLIESSDNVNRPITGSGSGGNLPTVSTFHALGVRILRENYKELGVSKYFTIFDRSDSKRAVKTATEEAGYETSQFEPKKILGTISKQKGEGVTLEEYEAKHHGEYYGTIVSEIWTKYEAILKKENAFDFDDLLLKTSRLLRDKEHIRKHYQMRWKYIHIDEYQDTNKVQDEIAELLVGERKNICVVGDIDQCVVKGTKVLMVDGKKKNIENIKIGDEVISNYGSGDTRSAPVTKTQKRKYSGKLISITTSGGNKLTTTEGHTHFAGYILDETPQAYFVYLMYKKNTGFRIGTSQVYTNGQRKKVVGFLQRSNQEHADALWILETHKTEKDARVAEYRLSLRNQIPTLPFVARKGNNKNGYVQEQKIIDSMFADFDTVKAGKKLLNMYNLSINEPHHQPQSRNSSRNNINISLCGDRRGKTPMHRISMTGNSVKTKETLKSLGYSVRMSKKDSLSWRFETCNKDFGYIESVVKQLKKELNDVNVIYKARLGKNNKHIVGANSLPFIKASSLRVGMALFSESGTYEHITKIEERDEKDIEVYDINVGTTHNFIANNIVTHNCIYTWRGAEVTNMLDFGKKYEGAKIVLLEENYRSTKTIIAASNRIIEKNNNRQEKNLFTNNEDGDKIKIFGSYSEIDEAYYIVSQAKSLIASGVHSNQIAVLYRANFQSRILEEAFLEENVPYQVLGVRFFDRKEVKDVLSFMRLSLNPESITDLKRVINVPPRGIGKTTLMRMVEGKENECSPAMRQKIADFREMLKNIQKTLETKKPSDSIKYIIRVTGIENKLSSGKEEDQERLENIRELVTLAKKYDKLTPSEAVEKLMTDAALATDQDELEEEQVGVKLMTVHAAKGLEFDHVFIAGLEEGLFPHEGGEGKIDDEEERRLFYVALTRARKKLFLTHASVRTIYGATQINIPSQFITDLDDDLVDVEGEVEPREKTVFLDLDDL